MSATSSNMSTETLTAITNVIEASFDSRPMPSGNITRREVLRRVELAKDVYLTLVNESGWTGQRALDHLPAFLVRGLDGLEPIPDWAKIMIGADGSAMWGAEAAGRVERERRLSALSRSGESSPIIIPGRGEQ